MPKRLTYEEVRKVFEDGGCELLSEEYKNSHSKLQYICKCGNISNIFLHNFKKGQRCQKCADKQSDRRLDIEYIKNFFKENNCLLLSKKYKNNRTKLDYICSCGRKGEITFNSFRNGGRCIRCCGKEKLTFEYVKQYFKQNNCELLEKKYINAHIKMKYKCECGNVSKINFNHFKNGRRCKKCAIKRVSGSNNWNYNSDITDEERKLKRFYPGYIKWRTSVYKKDDYTCNRCFQRGGVLNAHHIENYSSNKKLRLDINNGITLCKLCHDKFHIIYGKKNNNQTQLDEFLEVDNLCLK